MFTTHPSVRPGGIFFATATGRHSTAARSLHRGVFQIRAPYAIVAQSAERLLPKQEVAESYSAYRPIHQTITIMTEITAISRMTGKFAYHATFSRLLTEKQLEEDLKSMGVTHEKHIILVTYHEK